MKETTRRRAARASEVGGSRPARRYATMAEVREAVPSGGRLLRGHWEDPAFLADESFDLVLCDYVLGAVEHFVPFFQERLLRRLRNATRPGGLFVLVGREPLGLSGASAVAREIERVRDAAMLLSAQRPYREYPRDWAARRVEEAGLGVLRARSFPKLADEAWLLNELRWAKVEAEKVADAPLRAALVGRIGALGARVRESEALPSPLGADYAIVARRPRAEPRRAEPATCGCDELARERECAAAAPGTAPVAIEVPSIDAPA